MLRKVSGAVEGGAVEDVGVHEFLGTLSESRRSIFGTPDPVQVEERLGVKWVDFSFSLASTGRREGLF